MLGRMTGYWWQPSLSAWGVQVVGWAWLVASRWVLTWGWRPEARGGWSVARREGFSGLSGVVQWLWVGWPVGGPGLRSVASGQGSVVGVSGPKGGVQWSERLGFSGSGWVGWWVARAWGSWLVGQRSVVGGQRSEVGGQRSVVGGQWSVARREWRVKVAQTSRLLGSEAQARRLCDLMVQGLGRVGGLW